jgi:hypothetical protein
VLRANDVGRSDVNFVLISTLYSIRFSLGVLTAASQFAGGLQDSIQNSMWTVKKERLSKLNPT